MCIILTKEQITKNQLEASLSICLAGLFEQQLTTMAYPLVDVVIKPIKKDYIVWFRFVVSFTFGVVSSTERIQLFENLLDESVEKIKEIL